VVVARLATGYVLDTLREGDDLKLVCDVQSNPPPSRVIWYHNVSRKHRGKTGRGFSLSVNRGDSLLLVLIRRTDAWSTMWALEFCWLLIRWPCECSRSHTSASIPAWLETPWEKLTVRRFLSIWNVSSSFYLLAPPLKIYSRRNESSWRHERQRVYNVN